MSRYNPPDWYWIVAGSTTEVYASARAMFVPVGDATYISWLAPDRGATKIPTEAELWEVLGEQFPEGIASANIPGQNTRKDVQLNKADKIAFQVLFNHENRIRTLAGQPQLTAQQFRTAVKGLME